MYRTLSGALGGAMGRIGAGMLPSEGGTPAAAPAPLQVIIMNL